MILTYFVSALNQETTINCFFATGPRDVYLTFKLLNSSKTGYLSEDEFASIYDVISLKWKVIMDIFSIIYHVLHQWLYYLGACFNTVAIRKCINVMLNFS